MQLGRFQVSTLRPPPILAIDFSTDGRFFGVAVESGYEIWRSWPLGLVRRRKLPGTLARALPLPDSPLVALQGGGNSPLYPPNKVVLFNDATGQAVAELEFGERVRGLVARRGTVVVALTKRVVAFSFGTAIGSSTGVDKRSATLGGTPTASSSDSPHVKSANARGKARAQDNSGSFWVHKYGEWETVSNETGLMAISTSPGSTLLAIPGRQMGHVQLINLPPCPPLTPSRATPVTHRSPIILAHSHLLSSLACTANGSHIVTTSERGTLLRVWDTARGRLERELRRGVDRAEMWGAVLEGGTFGEVGKKEGEEGGASVGMEGLAGGRVIGWSDKGTVHVWGRSTDDQAEGSTQSSTPAPTAASAATTALTHLISRNLPLSLPKYFSSLPSTALYHLPRKNPHAFASAIGAAAEKARMPSMKMSQAEEEGDWSERFVVGWVEVEVATSDTRRNRMSGEYERDSREYRRSRDDSAMMGTREERRSFGSDATATPTIIGDSRTPTPTLGRVPGTAGAAANRSRASAGQHQHSLHERSFSNSSRGTIPTRPRRVTLPDEPGLGQRGTGQGPGKGKGKGTMRKERQLVAITYGGDWYRLRIPTTGAGVGGGEEDGKAEMEDGGVGDGRESGSEGRRDVGKDKDREREGEREREREGKDRKAGRRLELVEYRRLNVGGGGW